LGETNCTLELFNKQDFTLINFSKNLDISTNLYFNDKAIIYDLKEVHDFNGKKEIISVIVATDNGII
jgi:hypothetical protein